MAQQIKATTVLPSGVRSLRTLEGDQGIVRAVAFDRQGLTLASGGSDRTVRLWEVQSGRLLRILKWHETCVWSLAFDQQGRVLASGADDNTVKLWEVQSGRFLCTLRGHLGRVLSLAFDQQEGILASGGDDNTLKLWETRSGKLLRTIEGHTGSVWSAAFDPRGETVASRSEDNTVKLWEVRTGKLLHTLDVQGSCLCSLAFDPIGQTLVSGSDTTLMVWDPSSGKLLRTIEGHTGAIQGLGFLHEGRFLVSKGCDEELRIWNCKGWNQIKTLRESSPNVWVCPIACHAELPLIATLFEDRGRIHIWNLDSEALLGQQGGPTSQNAVHHTTAKILIVGDHSVGKSALGYRLIHERFEKQESTHGQQFWVFPALGRSRADGTECEAILWDLAGQPDYRLVHALFVDNADLTLVLFDASNLQDPLHGVGFWLNQLQAGQTRSPIILVAAQTDRGTCSLTHEELNAFCQKHGIAGPIATSASTGLGMVELLDLMKSLIPWEEKAAVVTTTTFKRIKDYVLGLKEVVLDGQAIVTPTELRERLQATDGEWRFSDAEMSTAVGHLENYGYVKRLRTSTGEQRILLQPERLNNLASSFVLAARKNPKGLGALEEKRLMTGDYEFPELNGLRDGEHEVLLDAVALLFLEHNVCFRETDPLRMEPYLVFPELINLKRPPEKDQATEDGVAYTVSGPTKNVFAALVVLLGYTHTFTRTAQWHNNARYEVGQGLACGFRQEEEREGELEFVLCFVPEVGPPVRTLFQGLFESFLWRHNLTVKRYEPVHCHNAKCGHLLDRSVVRQRLGEGKTFAFCNDCAARLTLPRMVEPIQLTHKLHAEVKLQRRAAEERTRFEQAIFRVRAYVEEQNVTPPESFISYAWGVPKHQRWVENRLATDLQKAGIHVVLDRWHNAQIGESVARFVERIEKSDRIVMIGTPLYRRKYENKEGSTGYVVAAEVDLINNRLLGTELQKRSVLPVLLDGDKTSSLPPMLHGRVYADFRNEVAYFTTAFDLILSLYQIALNNPAVADLRESLRGKKIG